MRFRRTTKLEKVADSVDNANDLQVCFVFTMLCMYVLEKVGQSKGSKFGFREIKDGVSNEILLRP